MKISEDYDIKKIEKKITDLNMKSNIIDDQKISEYESNENINSEEITDENVGSLLLDELITRIDQLYEFDQVRKLSVEILSNFKLENILEFIDYKINKNLKNDLIQLKSYLYCICNCIIKNDENEVEETGLYEIAFINSIKILALYSKETGNNNRKKKKL